MWGLRHRSALSLERIEVSGVVLNAKGRARRRARRAFLNLLLCDEPSDSTVKPCAIADPTHNSNKTAKNFMSFSSRRGS
jgi:hypothetical protein